jgi:hypothetical protein
VLPPMVPSSEGTAVAARKRRSVRRERRTSARKMSAARSHNRGLAWLLAVLLFGSAWGALLARLRPTAAGCAAAAHACCCAKAGRAQCACDGHDGTAAQLASLSTCAGASDLPAFLLAPPPAVPPPTSGEALRPHLLGFVPTFSVAPRPSAAPRPPTPPPQAT